MTNLGGDIFQAPRTDLPSLCAALANDTAESRYVTQGKIVVLDVYVPVVDLAVLNHRAHPHP